MISEKNIPKFIILTPVLTVVLIAFFTIYFFIQNQNKYFEEEALRVEEAYIKKQEELLKKELDYIINYLDYRTLRSNNISEEELKDELLRYSETIRYGKNGYIWIHDTSYFLRAHPFRQESLNTYDIALKDAMGTLITKKFIDETIKKPDGVFIEYYWQRPKELHFTKKLGFFRLYKKYNWVIGTGLYMDDIQKSIFENRKLLEKRINKYINLVVLISFIVILIIGLLSFLVSQKITKVLSQYQENVKKKEFLLEDLNKNLELKVQKAIQEVNKKDRFMYLQSRLARMGTMLSMIAHQWRQPLSEVSGILMELETAAKFDKADKKMIDDSVKQSNRQLKYMSNTIDDFRNFFKPDKKKVEFSVVEACRKAISLVKPTIKNLDIILEYDFTDDALVFGYKREFAQVIINLLSNAKDALNSREVDNATIFIKTKILDNKIFVYIEDNAGGIESKYINRVFEPYFTTKEKLKGSGLGLYMSKMIIEKNMQGELFVENINKGARFTLCLEFCNG